MQGSELDKGRLTNLKSQLGKLYEGNASIKTYSDIIQNETTVKSQLSCLKGNIIESSNT